MTYALAPWKAKLIGFARRLCADRKGNVLIIMGFMIIPLTFAVGFGVDYSRAEKLRTRLNAAADAAALIAVDPSMIHQDPNTVAEPAAQAMFTSQASKLSGLAGSPTVTVQVTDTATSTTLVTRTVTVSYKAFSQNMFGGILGVNTLPINGSSAATASQVPNINFYVMLDTSPSMLLPTTSLGIAEMTNAMNNTIAPNVPAFQPDPRSSYGQRNFYPSSYVGSAWGSGCAFACHEQRPDAYGEPNTFLVPNGNSILIAADYYTNYYPNNRQNGIYVYGVEKNGVNNVFDTKGTAIGGSATYTNTGATSTNNIYQYKGNAGTLTYYDINNHNALVTVPVNFADPFWVAENYDLLYPGSNPIELRIDAETTAAQNLIGYAQREVAALNNSATYQMQFYKFDYGPPVAINSSMMDVRNMSATDIAPPNGTFAPYIYYGSFFTGDNDTPPAQGGTNETDDEDTDFATMLSKMNLAMPDPGNGSGGGALGDSPQETLIIITDGMNDTSLTNNDTSLPSSGYPAPPNNSNCPLKMGNGSTNPNRICSELTPNEVNQCSLIKSRGIKIAILYVEYLPSALTSANIPSINPVADNNVPNILGQLQACATKNPDGTYLMATVTTDQSISDALNSLFATATQSAHLIR